MIQLFVFILIVNSIKIRLFEIFIRECWKKCWLTMCFLNLEHRDQNQIVFKKTQWLKF